MRVTSHNCHGTIDINFVSVCLKFVHSGLLVLLPTMIHPFHRYTVQLTASIVGAVNILTCT